MRRFDVFELAHYLTNPESVSALTLEEWEAFILILRESKLLASFYHLLVKHDCFGSQNAYVRKHLYSAFIHADRQRSQVLYECWLLDRLLIKVGVTPIYLKGANYILRESSNSHGRIVSDIDILVPKASLDEVEQLLKKSLWKSEELSDYDEKYYREWAHEIPPLIHTLRNTVLDVHHNLYLPISGRALDITLFASNSVEVGSGYRVLNAADSVLHSILHLFLNEDFTNAFRDLFDIYSLINEYQNDAFWARLEDVSHQTNSDKELYYCLMTLNRLFDFRIPHSLRQKLDNKHSGVFSRILLNSVFIRAITPKHEFLDTPAIKLSRFVVFLRGHWLKMPLKVLLVHLSVKSYKGAIESLFGKHYFDKA